MVDVDVVDASGVDLHRSLAGLGRGFGHFLVTHDVRTAGRVDADRFHQVTLREVSARCGRIIAPARPHLGRGARGASGTWRSTRARTGGSRGSRAPAPPKS